MLKILEVTETLASGVGAYVTQLCNDMCEYFEVYLAYSTRRPETPKNYREFISSRVKLIEIKGFANINDIKQDTRVIKELRIIEREIKPNIIHLHSSIAGGLGRIAFKGRNNTLVYTPHGYAHILMGGGVKSRVYKLMEQILGKRDCITLTCCESEDEVAKTLCKKTAYIETGVNLKDLSEILDGVEPEKTDRFTVFTLGRICVQKQPELFNRIAQLVPEARFLWIGDGELRSQLTAPNVEITGWKPRKEALAIAKGADAFVLCSLGEAIAMSLLENMYMGKLCLVSNVMGNKSVIQDGVNGYVCDSDEEYAAHIREAMYRFPVDLTRRANDDIQNIYNTKNMKKKFIEFYTSLIQRN